MSEQDPRPRRSGEFYVGYLPIPRGLLRVNRWAAALALAGLAAVAASLAFVQDPPGDGVWETTTTEIAGRVALRPAPMIFSSGDEGALRATLLVDFNKHGAAPRLEQLGAETLTVRGTRLARRGVEMLELLPTPEAARPTQGDAPPTPMLPEWRRAGVETLRGEIVDTKCYLGAMKPGVGRAHQACARLCIRGGIPPSLLTTSKRGDARLLLLVGPNGEPINESVLPHVGIPIELRGEVRRLPGAAFEAIRVDPADIRPL